VLHFVTRKLIYLTCMVFLLPAMRVQAEQWTQPTPEELSMTSEPLAPGAPAIYLSREMYLNDSLHSYTIHERIKVLTEAGRKYGEVRIHYASIFVEDFGEFSHASLVSAGGRTIQPNGTVVPFTGKVLETAEWNGKGAWLKQSSFALPDVQVGSIVEYRYEVNIGENWYMVPRWEIQGDLFLRKGSFRWNQSTHPFINQRTGRTSVDVAWAGILPDGVKLKSTHLPSMNGEYGYTMNELAVTNIPALPEEPLMPAPRSFRYHVEFYRSYGDATPEEYWAEEGKFWVKTQEKFIGPTSLVADIEKQLVGPADTDTVKLQKIYAAVMALDNTNYSRHHTQSEDQAQGLQEAKSVRDIWERKRGYNDQLALLFIALARAAGIPAYDMRVTNRDRGLFSPAWRTLNQLDDDIAVVELNGTEQFFDPGARRCSFGQLAWQHAAVQGIRETPGGSSAVASTPPLRYTDSVTQRLADLTLDSDGTLHGTLQMNWTGAPALQWRERALVEDVESVKINMKDSVENLLPEGMKAELATLDNMDDAEKPLMARFNVHGPAAAVTGKRVMLSGELFEAQEKALFPQPNRKVDIDMHYGGRVLDMVKVHLPAGVSIEELPKEGQASIANRTDFRSRVDATADLVTERRKLDVVLPIFSAQEYRQVRDFYNQVAATDAQLVVLKR